MLESYKFKNVATCCGKMHLKNEQGRDLYLNCFDVDSDNVYFIQLDQWKTGQDYSMIEVAQHSTNSQHKNPLCRAVPLKTLQEEEKGNGFRNCKMKEQKIFRLRCC